MTERVTPAMLTAATVADINSGLSALQRTSSELASGKKILEPSDDPYGASRVIDLQSQLDGLTSYAASVQDGISWQNAASSAMSNMNSILERVRELLVQAANGTNSSSSREAIAKEVTQLTEAVKQDAGDWADGDGRNGARQQNAGDHEAGMRKRHGQREDGDVVEVVANLADNLP